MRAQRVWRVNSGPSTAQLQTRLDDLNRRLRELETLGEPVIGIDDIKAGALHLSREIDDIRCAEAAEALSELLRK